jgi:hypothetical protein
VAKTHVVNTPLKKDEDANLDKWLPRVLANESTPRGFHVQDENSGKGLRSRRQNTPRDSD